MQALHTKFSYAISVDDRVLVTTVKNIASGAEVIFRQVAGSSDVEFSKTQMAKHMDSLTDDLIADFFPKERVVEEKQKKEREVVEQIDPVKAMRKAKKDAQSSSLSWEERVLALAYVYQNTDFTKDEKGFIFKDFGKLVNTMGKDASKAQEKK